MAQGASKTFSETTTNMTTIAKHFNTLKSFNYSALCELFLRKNNPTTATKNSV